MRFITKKVAGFLLILILLISVLGCKTTSPRDVSSLNQNSLVIRQMQSRVFDTGDEIKALKAAMSTLQDMSMKIVKTDSELKLVEGSKSLSDGIYTMASTFSIVVTIRSVGKEKNQILIRASAFKKNKMEETGSVIVDPIVYQNFFASLAKIMFLDAKTIDE